jgi:hypothetical protein
MYKYFFIYHCKHYSEIYLKSINHIVPDFVRIRVVVVFAPKLQDLMRQSAGKKNYVIV